MLFCLAFRRICFGLFFVTSILSGLLVAGCDSADYALLRSVNSADGSLSAMLIRRRGQRAVTSPASRRTYLAAWENHKASMAKPETTVGNHRSVGADHSVHCH